MKRYRFVALVNPAPGKEDAFNAWHSATHMPEVLKACGFTSGERMKLVDGTNGDNVAYRYLVTLEIETDDPMAVLGKMGAAVQSGAIGMSDTLGSPLWASMYEEIPGGQVRG